MTNYSEFTLVAIEAAVSAGNFLRAGFRTQFEITSKEGKHNLVTEYDLAAENRIIQQIKSHYPDHVFLAEESGKIGDKEDAIQWIIDPLDGTVNFAHGIPCFAVSIAAVLNKEILCGVVYQPITQELFIAEQGRGATLNGRSLKVTQTKDLDSSFLATGFPYNLEKNPKHCIEKFLSILKLGIPVRRLGVASIDLAYVASSRFDAFFEVSLAPWDCAAGILLIAEAKGKVTQWDQSAFDILSYQPILASNAVIHEELAAILSKEELYENT